MTETIDKLGPVDYLVVEFPGSEFKGEILPELAGLVQQGIVGYWQPSWVVRLGFWATRRG